MSRRLGWATFDGWTCPKPTAPALDWRAVDAICLAARGSVKDDLGDFHSVLKEWDARLVELGGDSSATDWSTFRPLRLSREEDWSDWLDHLLRSSQTGIFAASLFQPPKLPAEYFQSPKALREVYAGNYRADLVIEWSGGAATHLEVKVGDTQFEKTFPTAQALRKKYGQMASMKAWSDYILLPSESEEDWQVCVEKMAPLYPEIRISPITWEDVARSLRKAMWSPGEQVLWRAWAYAFLGSVEQVILGLPIRAVAMPDTPSLSYLLAARRRSRLMRMGAEKDER